jgi:hypothetical protein
MVLATIDQGQRFWGLVTGVAINEGPFAPSEGPASAPLAELATALNRGRPGCHYAVEVARQYWQAPTCLAGPESLTF